MNTAVSKSIKPASIHLTPSESDLLVLVATSRKGQISLTINPPPVRPVNGLISKGMAVKSGYELEITDLGRQRCTSIY